MSILLVLHITLMIVSLITTTAMVVLALIGKVVPAKARLANLIATSIGITIGAGLLIVHPIGSRCIELTSYIIVFYFAYRYVANRSYVLAVHRI